MNIISVKNLSKDFGQERVLHSVTRDFERGKIHGIVGNNGSGKTVLMKCICGFLIPTEGEVIVNGKRVGKDVDFPPDLGLIIETPGFLPNMTGVKNLEILASLNKKIGLEEIAASIRRVGLDPLMKKPVGKYSLGMRQRLGIAQAIMEDPRAAHFRRTAQWLGQARRSGDAAAHKGAQGAGQDHTACQP